MVWTINLSAKLRSWRRIIVTIFKTSVTDQGIFKKNCIRNPKSTCTTEIRKKRYSEDCSLKPIQRFIVKHNLMKANTGNQHNIRTSADRKHLTNWVVLHLELYRATTAARIFQILVVVAGLSPNNDSISTTIKAIQKRFYAHTRSNKPYTAYTNFNTLTTMTRHLSYHYCKQVGHSKYQRGSVNYHKFQTPLKSMKSWIRFNAVHYCSGRAISVESFWCMYLL